MPAARARTRTVSCRRSAGAPPVAQPDWAVVRSAPAQHPADPHHPAGFPCPRHRHARRRARPLAARVERHDQAQAWAVALGAFDVEAVGAASTYMDSRSSRKPAACLNSSLARAVSALRSLAFRRSLSPNAISTIPIPYGADGPWLLCRYRHNSHYGVNGLCRMAEFDD